VASGSGRRRRAAHQGNGPGGLPGWLGVVIYPAAAPLFVLVYGVFFFGVPFLTGAAPSTTAYIPYAFVSGPVALVPPLTGASGHAALATILGGTYGLYLVYTVLFRWTAGGGAVGLLTVLIALHALCTAVFLYTAGAS